MRTADYKVSDRERIYEKNLYEDISSQIPDITDRAFGRDQIRGRYDYRRAGPPAYGSLKKADALKAYRNYVLILHDPSWLIPKLVLLRKYLSHARIILAHRFSGHQTAGSFIERANRLAELKKVDAALDLLYDQVDEVLHVGEFGKLDRLLRSANTETLSADILLGLLTTTLPAKSKLPSRPRFCKDVERSLRRRNEWEEGLLVGLV
ncbi:MAG TPA: hypothetical protein VIS99_04965 [Terrimicrobiaceae bacterium]